MKENNKERERKIDRIERIISALRQEIFSVEGSFPQKIFCDKISYSEPKQLINLISEKFVLFKKNSEK